VPGGWLWLAVVLMQGERVRRLRTAAADGEARAAEDAAFHAAGGVRYPVGAAGARATAPPVPPSPPQLMDGWVECHAGERRRSRLRRGRGRGGAAVPSVGGGWSRVYMAILSGRAASDVVVKQPGRSPNG
jgi:hypothetical protein